ncbi:hypothetical protein C8Q76DRAFT_398353 [Earliella scabrosa]|nr:hypothetical protein C8Q76DRAFT_398353 [Earliella scabrosa]
MPVAGMMARLPLLALALTQWTIWFSTVKGQLSNTVCVDEYEWMINSKGQNPCLVAAYLYIPCIGANAANIGPLTDPNTWYLRVSGIDECTCNSVVYSALEACGRCQWNSTVNLNMLTWTAWQENCSVPPVSGYPNPIPPGTAVPAWAFQDVTSNDHFNVSEAFVVASADLPDTTASASPTPSPTPGSSSSVSSSSSQSSSSSSSSSESESPTQTSDSQDGQATSRSSTKIGPIVGGVVGGVVGAIALGAAAFYLLRRRQNRANAAAERVTIVDGYEGQRQFGPESKSLDMGFVPPMIYDPNDPRTFPTNPSPGSMLQSTAPTLVGSGQFNGPFASHSNLGFNTNGAVAAYKGAPEV